MRSLRGNFCRWILATAFGAIAIYYISVMLILLYRDTSVSAFIVTGFGFLVAAYFAWAAWFIFARRHAELFMLVMSVVVVVVLALCLQLPRTLGWSDAIRSWDGHDDWQPGASLFVNSALLLGPFIIASRLWKACSRFAARRWPIVPLADHNQSSTR